MKNSSINCVQKQLSNGYQTIVKFGKRIQVELTTNQIERLQNQLRIARLLELKQLWTSSILVNIGTVELPNWVKRIVDGTYKYSLHGELN